MSLSSLHDERIRRVDDAGAAPGGVVIPGMRLRDSGWRRAGFSRQCRRRTRPPTIGGRSTTPIDKALGFKVGTWPSAALSVVVASAPHLEKLRAGNIKLTPQERKRVRHFCRAHANPHASVPRAGARARLTDPRAHRKGDARDDPRSRGADREPPCAWRRAARGRASPLGIAGRGGRQCHRRAKQQSIALGRSNQLDELIESMNWNLFKAPEGYAFISPDNPVVVNDPLGPRARTERISADEDDPTPFPAECDVPLDGGTFLVRTKRFWKHPWTASPSTTSTKSSAPTERSMLRSNRMSYRRKLTVCSRKSRLA